MFGLFGTKKKKPAPHIHSNEIEPVDAEIPTVDAKRVYSTYLMAHGLKDDFPGVTDFADELREKTEEFKIDIQDLKSEIREHKKEIGEIKKCQILECESDEERTDLLDEIKDLDTQIENAEEEILDLQKESKIWKKDKRKFLIDYINRYADHYNEEHGI